VQHAAQDHDGGEVAQRDAGRVFAEHGDVFLTVMSVERMGARGRGSGSELHDAGEDHDGADVADADAGGDFGEH
jgi:hypothetical protein